jgi:hypothetical protein
MIEDLISRAECRQRVGAAFYQQGLIGPATDEEWKLIGQHGPEPTPLTVEETVDGVPTKHVLQLEIVRPSPPEIADGLARAVGRKALAAAQGRTIDHWLALYGFDPSEREFFSRADFEAAMAGLLGPAIEQLRMRILGAAAQTVPGGCDAELTEAALNNGDGHKPQGVPSGDPPEKAEPLGAQMRKSRGRPPEERDRIRTEMNAEIKAGKISLVEMQEMNQDALAAAYGAKHRQTAQDALSELLLENQSSKSEGISGISGTK